ncbi:hypothetical protein TrRE_jg12098, partial [Triparma retinervis]
MTSLPLNPQHKQNKPAVKASDLTASEQLSKFHHLAGGVSNLITATSLKLQKLTSLVKRSSLFSDPGPEIDRYVSEIGSDLKQLNSLVLTCSEFLSSAKGKLDGSSAEHTTVVVEA